MKPRKTIRNLILQPFEMNVMKSNGTRIILIVFFVYILLVMFSFSSYAQPDYDFTNGSLISGTDRQAGAEYRYTNVKPGVDAIVTITSISAGVKVTDMDAGSGYPEALQPTLDIDSATNGYLEMRFDFVKAGTFLPMVQLEIPVTCIDVDGYAGSVHEFDQITWGASAYMDYDMIGTELSINSSPGWMSCVNIGGIDYPGRDTSARQVMFTVVNSNLSTIFIRVGANNINTSSVATRLRSVYFKKFRYSNSFLAQPALLAFRGAEKNEKVELNWDLITDHHLVKVVVEKSTTGNYKPISEFWINDVANQLSFRYADNELLSGNTYYRLKMISANGNVQYSNILAFRAGNNTSQSFKVYPSLVNSTATVSMRSDKTGTAVFNLVDISGRVVFQQKIIMQEGSNNVVINGLDKITTGNYIAIVRNGNDVVQQKIIKQ